MELRQSNALPEAHKRPFDRKVDPYLAHGLGPCIHGTSRQQTKEALSRFHLMERKTIWKPVDHAAASPLTESSRLEKAMKPEVFYRKSDLPPKSTLLPVMSFLPMQRNHP